MEITIRSTTQIVTANGIECRVWAGHTASGIAVECLIPRIAVAKDQDTTQFEAELQEHDPPRVVTAFPLRLVL